MTSDHSQTYEINISDLAQRMLADYDGANPGSVFADGRRLDLPDAWLKLLVLIGSAPNQTKLPTLFPADSTVANNWTLSELIQ